MTLTAPNRPTRRLSIEFLYLDRSRCTRCQATDTVLDDAVAEVAADLRAASVVTDVRKVHVQTEEQARQLGLVSSPTIRINGRDIAPDIIESACASCSCGCEEAGVACRVWPYQGKDYDAPPKALIVESIRRAIADPDRWGNDPVPPLRDVPENLQRFFAAAPRARDAQCCGG